MQSVQFLDVLNRMIPAERFEQLCTQWEPRTRTERKLSTPQLISGLVYHQLQDAGTLARNSAHLHGIYMSDSAHSQRRQQLPVELFEQIARDALAPLADPALHADSFFNGYRLLGIDGTQFNAVNTSAIVAQLPKAATRRYQAAFAKLRMVSVVELGTHAPVAVSVAPASEGEQRLAQRLWDQVPEHSLVIGDRLFGTARTLWEATQSWGDKDIVVLARVRDNIRVRVEQRLADGSALVEVPVRDDSQREIARLKLREIQAEGTGGDGKRFTLRLWTTLLDHERYPALQLAQHYAQRWECELYYRELKSDLLGIPVLAAQTFETALQEVLALVLGSAVLARLRVEAGTQLKVAPQRMSFLKLKLETQHLWNTYEIIGDTLSAKQRQHIWTRYMELVRLSAILPKRRARSCPRVLRKPVSKWPRKLTQPSHTGKVTIKVVHV
jgi:hypothetical protein